MHVILSPVIENGCSVTVAYVHKCSWYDSWYDTQRQEPINKLHKTDMLTHHLKSKVFTGLILV